MRLGLEIKFRRSAPSTCLDILCGIGSHWHTGVWKIRDRSQDFPQTRFGLGSFLFGGLDLLAQILRFLDQSRGVLTALLELGDFFGSAVAPSLQRLILRDGLPAFGVERM